MLLAEDHHRSHPYHSEARLYQWLYPTAAYASAPPISAGTLTATIPTSANTITATATISVARLCTSAFC